MISLLLVILAAICNAVMDRVGDHVAFNASIFRNKDVKFWSKEVSWQYARKVFGWKADAWHVAKSCMVVLLIAAVVFYEPFLHICKNNGINAMILAVVFGTIWNATFNLFYNHIFKK